MFSNVKVSDLMARLTCCQNIAWNGAQVADYGESVPDVLLMHLGSKVSVLRTTIKETMWSKWASQ